MTGNKAEAKAIEIIKSLGYNVTVCDQQTDYNGVDCVIDGKNRKTISAIGENMIGLEHAKSCSLKDKKWKLVDGKRTWYEL